MPTEPRRNVVRITPGQYVLTEHRGRFYAVGSVLVADRQFQARCCQHGHPDDSAVGACWAREVLLEALNVRP